MVQDVNLDEFLQLRSGVPVIDVRSPVEFSKGHIPGSVNIPLFSDDERAAIGILYNRKGEDKAIALGESFAVPRIGRYVEEVKNVAGNGPVIIYCFRGGMRSGRFASMLDENQFSVYRLEGGYKRFRRGAAAFFASEYELKVLGGRTGSGKTDILKAMKDLGAPVIDLEGLACHKGSAFGSIGMDEQPGTEHFENLLFENLKNLENAGPVWVEDESRNIGSIFLPEAFFEKLRKAPLFVVELDSPLRIERLYREYTSAGLEPLVRSLEKIRRRMGGDTTNRALKALDEGNLKEAVSIVLGYYDKCYDYSITEERNPAARIVLDRDDPREAAGKLISF